MNNWLDWLDDKTQVIMALFILAIVMVFVTPEIAKAEMKVIIGGLLGVAIGKTTK